MSDENLDNSADTESQPAEESKPSSLADILNPKEDEENETEDSDSDESGNDDETGTDETGKDEEEEIEEEEESEVDEEVDTDETLNASFSGLKKEYPDIFKKFPGLRNKLGREYAYSELFPTVDEARSSAKKAEVFDIYEKEFQLGNPDSIISALPNIQAAGKFAEGILPALRAANPDLLTKAVDPFVRIMLNKIDKDSTSSGDKNLNLAAKYISQYLYGDAKIPSLPTRQANQPDPEKEALRAQVQANEDERYSSFESSVGTAINKNLTKEVGLLLDPKDSLAPKLKEVLIQQVIKEVDSELTNNPTHMAKMRAHIERAKKAGLGQEFKSRILSAYLSAARPVLRSTSQRIKTEALGKKNESKTLESQDKGRKVIPSSPGASTKPPSKSSSIDWRNIKQAKAKGLQMEDLLGG